MRSRAFSIQVDVPSHFTRRILQVIHPVLSRFTDFLVLLPFSAAAVVSMSESGEFLLRPQFEYRR